MSTQALSSDNTMDRIIIPIWLSLLAVSLSLSLAISNILIALGIIYIIKTHFPSLKSSLNMPIIKALLITALLFQCMESAYDGWFIAKASKVTLLFTITFIIANYINQTKTHWLPWLLHGLIIGLIGGTIINQYINPTYHLWATYSMTYANQAAGFAITVGLLSLATKKWWLIIPILASMLLYVYMSGERAAIPALGLSCIILLAVLHKYKTLISLVLAIIAGTWLYSTYSASPSQTQNVRFDIWQYGLLIAKKDMFLGRGEYHEFNQSELDLYKGYATGPGKNFLQSVTPGHPSKKYNALYHNQFVQFLVEYGAIGVLIFLIFLIFPIIQAWKIQSLNTMQQSFIMLWTAFSVHCIFETSFDAHSAIILGLLAGLMNTFRPSREPQPDSSKRGKYI